MKGNLAQVEPKMLGFWSERKIYDKLLDKNRAAQKFVFHDGPPYANGHLHAGHALNKVLKDIIVKYRNMSGQLCEMVPGWDCHGLPIEQAAEKRLREKKVDKRTLSREQFLEACRAYALEFVDIQRDEFKRLGAMASWDAPYETLTFDYEAQEIRELATVARNGLLYRKKKPVYWCVTDQTALAEAEVEYDDHDSPSVYVAFRHTRTQGEGKPGTLQESFPALKGKDVDFVIWTTTPWTLPANLAIAAHPALEYVFYDLGQRVIVVAKELLPSVLSQVAPEQLAHKDVSLPAAGGAFNVSALTEPQRILGYVSGEDLEGYRYQHPFAGRQGPVILGQHVTLDAGTGLVHTAPGHGQEDYEVGLKYGLDIYNPVKGDGRYDDSVRPASLAGIKVFEANPQVVDLLGSLGVLLSPKDAKVSHSYPHCWRCHNPIIFRATNQWFIALDGATTQLRARALREIERVNWIPTWGRDRIHGMLEGRPDWCISRQRTWGVPIPVALCEGCETPLVSPELMERVAAAVEKEGVGVWYRGPLEDFLPPGTACASCGKSTFRKETDILDVWFDSAVSFAAVAQKRPNLGFPVDLYLEGSDQHRGWFHSSLLVSVATRDTAPYRSVLTHGFVVDGQGKKMSKSLGNTIAPEQIIKQYGAEVVRLWVASSDYRDDVRLSDQILKGLAEGYRKIRNTLRYALSNLYDFDPGRDKVEVDEMLPLDRWAREKLAALSERVKEAYKNYEFHLVYHAVVEFCGAELSAVYFDILKDRLYTSRADGKARRSAQTVLHEIAHDLVLLLAPIMSFTAEEAWQLLPGRTTESVFLAPLPTTSVVRDPDLMVKYEELFAVRSAVQKVLEAARRDKVIGSSLEARVVLSCHGEARGVLEAYRDELPSLFIVSQVEVADSPGPKAQSVSGVLGGGATLSIEVHPAQGAKCPRCWTYTQEVAQGAPVCKRCEEALR
jgi:isoleucyl-tRNA synthetase